MPSCRDDVQAKASPVHHEAMTDQATPGSKTTTAIETVIEPHQDQSHDQLQQLGSSSTQRMSEIKDQVSAKAFGEALVAPKPAEERNETEASLSNVVAGIAGMAVTAPSVAAEKLGPVLTQTASQAQDTASSIASGATQKASEFGQSARETTGNFAQSASGMASYAATRTQETVQQGLDKFKQTGQNVVGGATQGPQSTRDTISDQTSRMTSSSQGDDKSKSGAGLVSSVTSAAYSYLPESIQSYLPGGRSGESAQQQQQRHDAGQDQDLSSPSITHKASETADKAAETARDAKDKIVGTTSSAARMATDTATSAKDTTVDTASGSTRSATATMQGEGGDSSSKQTTSSSSSGQDSFRPHSSAPASMTNLRGQGSEAVYAAPQDKSTVPVLQSESASPGPALTAGRGHSTTTSTQPVVQASGLPPSAGRPQGASDVAYASTT
ncbi:BQ2448_6791 [Microbotryum intermedium]|uniref:BQ2448_6791 protein n=1 Tax=Microbotryum intermedium TaxID=269621 RepID=A0A238FNJ4_9BASI|nr:BQ2448_6791 [Microbotryum intermedium]